MLKQGKPPRGIIAAGWVTSDEVYDVPHYDARRAARGDTALRADVEFERIVHPAEHAPLSVETIDGGPLARVCWQTPASGIGLPEDAASELEALWARHVGGIDGPAYPAADEAAAPEEGNAGEEPSAGTGTGGRSASGRSKHGEGSRRSGTPCGSGTATGA